MNKSKYIVTTPSRDGILYLESHAQTLIFKAHRESAKVFNSKQEIYSMITFWKRQLPLNYTIEPVD